MHGSAAQALPGALALSCKQRQCSYRQCWMPAGRGEMLGRPGGGVCGRRCRGERVRQLLATSHRASGAVGRSLAPQAARAHLRRRPLRLREPPVQHGAQKQSRQKTGSDAVVRVEQGVPVCGLQAAGRRHGAGARAAVGRQGLHAGPVTATPDSSCSQQPDDDMRVLRTHSSRSQATVRCAGCGCAPHTACSIATQDVSAAACTP